MYIDININNLIGKKFCDDKTLCLSYFLPFINIDVQYNNSFLIEQNVIKYIKKQKYLLKNKLKKYDKSIFFFVTEPSYGYLINQYKDFLNNVIYDYLGLNNQIYISCFVNDSVNNFDYFFDQYLNEINIDWDFMDLELIKDKKFITLNNRKRKHREDLCDFMKNNSLLNDSYYSFLWNKKQNLNQSNDFYNDIKINHIDDYNKIIKNISFNKMKNYFNNDNLWTNHQIINYFKKSYIYIITERDYSNHCIFITEKTYKSFLYKIPFILIGNPYSLKYLKDKGFKTFSPYIDESYDEEKNYTKRKKKIYDEILRLNSINLNNLYDNLKETLDYNYNLMKIKKDEFNL
jgi:hypothetical protein